MCGWARPQLLHRARHLKCVGIICNTVWALITVCHGTSAFKSDAGAYANSNFYCNLLHCAFKLFSADILYSYSCIVGLKSNYNIIICANTFNKINWPNNWKFIAVMTALLRWLFDCFIRVYQSNLRTLFNEMLAKYSCQKLFP